jgi:DNA invertase Pin-like site-specific DNA recombinase
VWVRLPAANRQRLLGLLSQLLERQLRAAGARGGTAMTRPHGREGGQWYTATLLPRHGDRLAVVCARQSTTQQVSAHQQSTRLQDGLVRRAVARGWPESRVLVIADAPGRSGTRAEGRQGFQRLVAEVGPEHVGLVVGGEMSRLARSSKDWHQPLESCALFGTSIADLDGIDDPRHRNDRLLLGLKGTMRAAERRPRRQRGCQGTRQRARRGALRFALPGGCVHHAPGQVVCEPDAQVHRVVRLIFRKFDQRGTRSCALSSGRTFRAGFARGKAPPEGGWRGAGPIGWPCQTG